ncbi:MAG: hypothetical protein ACI841_003552 [Planctomycetota bacterium]|jgi:hypothetical protein
MQLKSKVRRYDPHSYFIRAANIDLEIKVPEHPRGGFHRRTNSLGLRNNEETREDFGLRVLIAGDSHVDGVCGDSENLCAHLEHGLCEAGHDAHLLNAGMGAYSMYHYLGTLERFPHLELTPDLFIVVMFGGNDLGAVPALYQIFDQQEPPRPSKTLRKLDNKSRPSYPAEYGQGFNPYCLFRALPSEIDVARKVFEGGLIDIQDLCEQHDIQLLLAYLQAPVEVRERLLTDRTEELMQKLAKPASELEPMPALSDEVLDFARTAGIEVHDLRPGFTASNEVLYWSHDLHLNITGHRLAANE